MDRSLPGAQGFATFVLFTNSGHTLVALFVPMKKFKLPNQIFLCFAILVTSCDDGENPAPVEPITILGKWFFTQSSSELISKDDNVEVDLPIPNISGLEWTFLENDSLLVVNQDTTFMSWYHYDTMNMRLDFDDGFYDVLQHTDDSLNLRFYTDITVAEFYVYFQLIR